MDSHASIEGEAFTFEGVDGTPIHGLRWLPSTKPKAILIINHGMAEHIARYGSFASFLVTQGLGVYGKDHRGHGRTAPSPDDLGHFSDEDGWMKVLGDIRCLYREVIAAYPGLRIFLFGHSMGSFLTRHYISLYGEELSGAIICGTGSHGFFLLRIAHWLARTESHFRGKRHRSKLLDRLSFGNFNRPFKKEGSTGFEWLSRDQEEVRKYKEDPLCGFICSTGFFMDLFFGLKTINRRDCFKGIPNNFPLFFYSGTKDPVGGYRARGVTAVFNSYHKRGKQDLTIALKRELRHECLNELGKEEVYLELYQWLERYL